MRSFNEASAKAYIIDLIVEQARRDGESLSEAEMYNLAWSYSDPGFEQKPELDMKFEQETTSEAFEKKIGGLIKRAYDDASASSSDAKRTFKAACKAMSRGDHYLQIVLRAALGLRMQSWWPF